MLLEAEEREGGVSLAVGAGLVEIGDDFGKGVAGVVFGDDEGIGGEKRFGGLGRQAGEDMVVFGFFGVWGVDVDEVERGWVRLGDRQLLEGFHGVQGEEGRLFCELEGVEILADQGGGGLVVLDEGGVDGAAAEGLDAYCAGSGVDVEEAGALDGGAEDVEEGFADVIAGGTKGRTFQGFQEARAVGAGDYAHGRRERFNTEGAKIGAQR